MKKYDYLIIGAGLFGSIFAHEAYKVGKHCLVIDKRAHSGGNIYCESISDIQVHKYGAHIFHTSNKAIWEYVNKFIEFNRFTNSPLALYKGQIYNLPFNMNTFYQLWGVRTPQEARNKIKEETEKYKNVNPKNLEEQVLKLCGYDIYQTLIKGYTEKQWGRSARELPPFIIKRIPFRFTYDNNYFNDTYQGIPKGGYNAITNLLLSNTEVQLDTNYFDHRYELNNLADKILFTGCIDEYFDYIYGQLEYRSLRFVHKLSHLPDFQGNAVVNYTDAETPYTRIIEHKHFEFGTQPHTVITYEYPDNYEIGKEPYYPVNDEKNTRMFNKYLEIAEQDPKLRLGGRLAKYTYADMDDIIEEALNLCAIEFNS